MNTYQVKQIISAKYLILILILRITLATYPCIPLLFPPPSQDHQLNLSTHPHFLSLTHQLPVRAGIYTPNSACFAAMIYRHLVPFPGNVDDSKK